MTISAYRKRVLVLAGTVVFVEAFGFWLAYKPYDLLMTVVTGLSTLLLLTLLGILLVARHDWLFRVAVLIPFLAYVAFKLWTLWAFVTGD